jgi:hypothetical protein
VVNKSELLPMETPCTALNSKVRGGVVGEALGYKP